MCERCDNKAVFKPWKTWLGIGVTVLVLIISQVFIYGQLTQTVQSHLKDDPTHKQMTEEFVTQREFQLWIKSVDDKLQTITELLKGN
jgi:hypothetical protein